MSVPVIKQLCRQIERRLGGGKYAAQLAGVSPGVWSGYVSDEHPDKTIPLGRLLDVANARELSLIADLLTGSAGPSDADLQDEAADLVEGAAALMATIRKAGRDRIYTPAEKRAIRAEAAALLPELQDILQAVGE